MGGGNKQRQPRVKGNLKSSSSSQAATLLGTDTAAINAFKVNPALAFSQFGSAAAAQGGGRLNWSQSHDGTPNSQESPAPRTASGADGRSLNCKSQQLSPSSSEASISDIDGELASLLKRLTKQDAQTRLKAIKEVSAYVEGRDAKQLNGMLLAWPSPYRRHIIDIDRRVRGEVAKVHYQLVTKMGKRLAPRLKEVIGPWVLGFFDQSREVASYSRMAFEDAFSPSRREEVFAYCLDDLAEFIRSNLHDELPDTLSDPRFLDKDQRQSKYEQVVACSFRGLGKVFDLLNKDTLEKRTLCEPLQAILEDQRTWKFASSSSSLVRRSIYKCVKSLVLKYPAVMSDNGVELLATALYVHGMKDRDPNNHGDLLDACLLVAKYYPQVWEQDEGGAAEIGRRRVDAYVTGILKFLATGCPLAPQISYPSVVVLLSRLPPSISQTPTFTASFFDAMWDGLRRLEQNTGTPTAAASPSSTKDHVTFTKSLCECLSWICTRFGSRHGISSKSEREIPPPLSSPSSSELPKFATKEVDRLWHYYLHHPSEAGNLAEPIANFYLSLVSAPHTNALLEQLWSQTVWFVLKKLTASTTAPIVTFAATVYKSASRQVAMEGGSTTSGNSCKSLGELVRWALQLIRKLKQASERLSQLDAPREEDKEVARIISRELITQVPQVVFQSQGDGVESDAVASVAIGQLTTLFEQMGIKPGEDSEATELVVSRLRYEVDEGDFSNALAMTNAYVSRLTEWENAGGKTFSASGAIQRLLNAIIGAQIFGPESSTSPLPALDAYVERLMQELPRESNTLAKSEVDSGVAIMLTCLSQFLDDTSCSLVSERVGNGVLVWVVSAVYDCYRKALRQSFAEADEASDDNGISEDDDGEDRHGASSRLAASWFLAEILKTWRVLASRDASKARFIGHILGGNNEVSAKSLFVIFELASNTSSSLPDTLQLASVTSSTAGVNIAASTAWSAVLVGAQQLGKQDALFAAIADSIAGFLHECTHPVDLLALLAGDLLKIVAAKSETADHQGDNSCGAQRQIWEKLVLTGQSRWHAALGDRVISNGNDDLMRYVVGNDDKLTVGYTAGAAPGTWYLIARGPERAKPCELPAVDKWGLTQFARQAVFMADLLHLLGASSSIDALVSIGMSSRGNASCVASLVLHLAMAWNMISDATLSGYVSANYVTEFARSGEEFVEESRALLQQTQHRIVAWIARLLGDRRFVAEPVSWQGDADVVSSGHRSDDWVLQMMHELATTASEGDRDTASVQSLWSVTVAKCLRWEDHEGVRPAHCIYRDRVLGSLAFWYNWARPPTPSHLEVDCLSPLQQRLVARRHPLDTPRLLSLSAVFGALNVRQHCARLPTLAMLIRDLLGMMSDSMANPKSLVGYLCLVNELVPLARNSLDGSLLFTSIVDSVDSICKRYPLPEHAAGARPLSDDAYNATITLNCLCARLVSLSCASTNRIDAASVTRVAASLLQPWIDSAVAHGSSKAGSGGYPWIAVIVFAADALHSLIRVADEKLDDIGKVELALRPLVDKLMEASMNSAQLHNCTWAAARCQKRIVGVVADAMRCRVYTCNVTLSDARLQRQLLNTPAASSLAYFGLISDPSNILGFVNTDDDMDALLGVVAQSAKNLADAGDVYHRDSLMYLDSDTLDRETSSGCLTHLLVAILTITTYANAITAIPEQREIFEQRFKESKILDKVVPTLAQLLHVYPASNMYRPFNLERWDVRSLDKDSLDTSSSVAIRLMAAHSLYQLLWALPATFRTWLLGHKNHGFRQAVEGYAVKYLSPDLVRRELQIIADNDHGSVSKVLREQMGSSGAKISYKLRQVTLKYTVDETTLEAVVRLPENYPLNPPEFQTVRRIAVSEKRWRAWIVASQSLLAKNGRLDNACALYLRNIGAHFDGIEDCTICYSAVGVMDNQLPNKQCKTCKNMFHAACLFKWFRSSSQSTCPLCRSLF